MISEDHVTLKTNTALITGINYILTDINIENSYFKMQKYFTIFNVFLII